MESAHPHNLKRNTLYSILSLFFQSGYAAVLGLVANFILTFQLETKTFGIYVITLSCIAFFNYFSDIGLAASLVQKKEVDETDLKTTFTIQQILIATILLVGFSLQGFISSFYGLPAQAVHLYYALLVSFFLSSLKTIPSILLERKLQFQTIVLVQIIEHTLFYVSVSIFALMHLELMSFAYAVLIRSSIGTICMHILSGWRPGFAFSRKHLEELLSFGVPFQTNTFLALIKDDLIMLYLGRVLGLDAVGYIGWAKRWAEAPIRIIMDNITRILFPVFSRIQENKEKVSQALNKVMYYQTLILAPVYVCAVLLMDVFIQTIPKYNKWGPALPLFYLMCLSAFCSSFSTPFINLFNALGKVQISFRFMLGWTAATWLLIPILSLYMGMFSYPITLVLLSCSFIIVLFIAKTLLPVHFLKNTVSPFFASLIMGIVVYAAKGLLPGTMGIGLALVVGIVSYPLILLAIFRINLFSELQKVFKI